jgi:hypothetical protein
MTIKKGSLIRRLAQERREQPDADAGEVGAALTLSVDGLLKDEKPALQIAPGAAAPAAQPLPMNVEAPAIKAGTSNTMPGSTEPAEKGGPDAPEAPVHAEASGLKRTGASRFGRLPGRQRKRHGEVCVRHPGEEKRSSGARAWLTPEESEKLELLATAYQVSTSTLTRDIILEGLAAHGELIEKTRRFLDSLWKGRASA